MLLSAVFLITPICSFAEGEDIKTDISVSVKATGFNQVGVYWNIQNAPNAKYYTVFKSTSENSGFADVSGFIVNKSFTVKKLTYNKNYYFIVKAYDENKNLIISSVAVCGNTKSVKVNKPEARLMNGDIWAGPGGIIFNTVPGASGYELYFKLDKNEVADIESKYTWQYSKFGYNKWNKFKTTSNLKPKYKKSYTTLNKKLYKVEKCTKAYYKTTKKQIKKYGKGVFKYWKEEHKLYLRVYPSTNNSKSSISLVPTWDTTGTFPSFKIRAYKIIKGKRVYSKFSEPLSSYKSWDRFIVDNDRTLTDTGYKINNDDGFCAFGADAGCNVLRKVCYTNDGKISTTRYKGVDYVNYVYVEYMMGKNNYEIHYYHAIRPQDAKKYNRGDKVILLTERNIKRPANVPEITRDELPKYFEVRGKYAS